MIATMTLVPALLAGAALVGAPADAKVTWNAPTRFVKGHDFPVEVRIEAPKEGAAIANWLLTPGAFLLNGKPVQERKGGEIVDLAPGTVLSLKLDLSGLIEGSSAFKGGDFELSFAKEYLETEPIAVRVFEPAPADTDFMTAPIEGLADCQVIMETNRGTMVFEFYPKDAPKHVRNFLDLCASGFYEGTLFHRVSPSFMIQGGCPNTKTSDSRYWGTGNGPRHVDAEFGGVKHDKGVLSMARTGDPNSASCQFFVMTARSPHLDGSYSSFGRMVSGEEALDLIANASGARGGDGTVRPAEPQKILRTTVVRPVSAGKSR